MTNIKIKDIGPIVEFEYQMEAPGLHILRGTQGSGKSTCLRTVQLATDGRTDVKPTKRDATARGEAEIAGKTLRITKSVREEGDLTVEGLGDLSIADLHTPKFLDAPTRDRHRIKALVRLAGVEADASMFYSLVGGKTAFDAIVPADSLKTDDLVEMAARTKRAIEKAAQVKEAESETCLSNMRSEASRAEGVDLNAPSDAGELQETLTTAIEKRSQLGAKRSEALAVINRAEHSLKELDGIAPGQTVEEANAVHDSLMKDFHASADKIKSLQEELRAAEANHDLIWTKANAAHKACEAATSLSTTIAAWRHDISAAEDVDCPSEEACERANAEVEAAQAALTAGVTVRAAKTAKAAVKQYSEAALIAQKAATKLRNAAKDTSDVLTAAIAKIPGCPLKVKLSEDGDARLVIASDRSETEPFDDLSDGEKWIPLLNIAAGRNKLIVLNQAAFGELAPSTREQLHELATERELFILTAQADDGALRGEIYHANGQTANA